jgi:signal transduction histidine kinase
MVRRVLAGRDRTGAVARTAVVVLAVALFAVRTSYWLGLGHWLWLMLITATVQFLVVVAGLVATVRRPDSRVGVILLAWGFYTLVVGLGSAESGVLLVLTYALQPWYWALLAHALLTYPDGHTRNRSERWFLRLAYAVPLWWFSVTLVAEPGWLVVCPPEGCPDNPVLIAARRSLVDGWFTANNLVAIGFGVWFLALVVARHRAMTPAQRRSAAPALWALGALLSAYLLHAVLSLFEVPDGGWWALMWWIRRLATVLVPVGLLIGLVSRKLGRAEVAGLLVRLRDADAPVLQAGLIRLLRDPTLRIVTQPPRDSDLDTETTELADGFVLVHHRSARTEDEELFEAAVTAARMALDNARLAGEVKAQLAEVTASRQRLAQAAETERRRVERDLHDGAQQQLIGVGIALESARLALPESHPATPLLDEATSQLRQSLAELRSLARGLRPAMLAERGLAPALTELRRRTNLPVTLDVAVDRRLPADVESAAYFVVAEALQNATRYAPGSSVDISVRLAGDELFVSVRDDGPGGADGRAGTGLRGLADRTAAFGGELTVLSPAGAGTTVSARLPVGPGATQP